MMQASGWGMGHATLKIALSLVGAGTVAFCVFVLLEAMLRSAGSVLFRFQLSSMMAMGVFAGIAILIYVRLSRRLSSQPGSGGYRAGRSKKG
jgi:hypothetical protein